MKKSTHNGKPVIYVDHFKLTHTGVVVGMSDDGKWLLIHSDHPSAPSQQWHFKVAANWFDLVKA